MIFVAGCSFAFKMELRLKVDFGLDEEEAGELASNDVISVCLGSGEVVKAETELDVD